MSFLRTSRIKSQARADGAAGLQHLGGKRVVGLIGPRPEYDSTKYADHGFLADNLQSERRIDELQELAAPVGERTGPSGMVPSLLLLLGVILFGLADVAASIRLMVLLGVPPHDRLVLGVALACILVALTYAVHNVTMGILTGSRAVVAILGYSLFLLAAAAVRLSDITPGGGLGFWDIVSSILLVLTAAGPAAMCEICFRALIDGAPRRAARRNARRRLRVTEYRLDRAQRDMAGLGRRQREWDAEHSRLMALYNSFYAHAEAAHNGKPHTNENGRNHE